MKEQFERDRRRGLMLKHVSELVAHEMTSKGLGSLRRGEGGEGGLRT